MESYSDAVTQLGVGLPDTSEQAQFSMSWPIAVMLIDGEVHPRSMSSERLADTDTRILAAKVKVHENPELTRVYLLSESNDPSGREAAIVRIKLDDGTLLDSGVVGLQPYLQAEQNREMIENKFRWVTSDVLPNEHMEAVIEASRDLPALENVAKLVKLLAARKPRTASGDA